MFVHDFALLFDRKGNALNPPEVPPETPILETYPGDELMIRLIDGAHEEQHSFNVTGMSWRKELADPRSPLAASQTDAALHYFFARYQFFINCY